MEPLPLPPPAPILCPERAQIPPTLLALDRWVCWNWSFARGEWTKVPLSPETGLIVTITPPIHCRSFATASAYAHAHGVGLAFVFVAEDGLAGVDIDSCRDPHTGLLDPDTQALMTRLDSYTEVSPSGTGIKIFCRGQKPGTRCRSGSIELYTTQRFFTVTGLHLAGTPMDVQDAQESLTALYTALFTTKLPTFHVPAPRSPLLSDEQVEALARKAGNAAKFVALFDRGDTTGYTSASEADSALLLLLAFYTQDPTQLEALFTRSALSRVKWTARPDYRARSIRNVLGVLHDTYRSNAPLLRFHRPASAPVNAESPHQEPPRDEGVPADEPQDSPPAPGRALPPFPVEALLSPSLQAFVTEAATALDGPVDFAAWAALGACSVSIGTSRVVALNHEWKESALLWVALVGNPGTGKTPALQKATAPLWALQGSLIADWEQEKLTHDAAVAQWEAQPKGVRDAKPTLVPPKRFVVSDTTFEALTNILRINERGVGVVRDELAGWIESFNQYKKAGGQDRAAWLSTWSSSPLVIDRKTNDYMAFVERPYAAVLGTIQPARLAKLSADTDDGFMDRVLFSFPDAWPMRWTEQSISTTVMEHYRSLLYELLRWPMAVRSTTSSTKAVPQEVQLSDAARALFADLFERHRQEMLDADLPSTLLGVWAKYRSYAGRLALLLHCAQVADPLLQDAGINPLLLTEVTVLAAWALIDHLKAHARRVYLLASQTEDDHVVDRAIAWIRLHGGTVTIREAVRVNLVGITGSKAATALFEALVDRGLGRVDRLTRAGGSTLRFVAGFAEKGDL